MQNTTTVPDAAVAQFMNVTGETNSGVAQQYLQMTGNDIEQAVMTFLEAPPHVEKDREGDTVPAEGEQLAEDDPLRAPDLMYSQTLLASANGGQYTLASSALSGTVTPTREMPVNSMTSYGTPRTQGDLIFSNLFSAPKDMISQKPFSEARTQAVSGGKMILVNIQKSNEFESHRLNRDVWNDEVIQDVVRCSFVFWQRAAGTEDANAFEATYKVAVVPCILVIEPRTGRALKRWASKEFCDSSTAQSKLIEFIEEYEKSKPRELSTLDSAAVSSPEHEAAQAHQQDSVGSSSSSASSSGRTANVLGGTLGGEEGSAESEQTTMAYSNMNATLADLARMRAERIGRQPQEGS
eukprot:GHVT01075023.1.p1 GENE.GHVT01075023.1~~GHVT01075023.1.p1  ORF type:complete len:352 (-),score=50.53 GHVT01075023.1:2365-3420(-)